MVKKLTDYQVQIIIILLSSVLFIPFLGGVHLFDWDEINFAESAREMIVSHDYLTVKINFLPFWEKPPLFIWVQVLSMKIFGINEFAARFPNALCGIISLLVIYNIGKKYLGQRFGIIWILVFAGSILPFFYFKSGIIDPWFNLFIFLGIYFFIVYLEKSDKRKLYIILSAVFIGLGILTKGPVALLVFLLTGFVFLIFKRFKIKLTIVDACLFIIFLSFTGGFWFILQILNGNYNIIIDFIHYQVRLFTTEDAGHGGFLLYHFVILFVGVFPASIFAIKSFRKIEEVDTNISHFRLWMKILFWVVLILFTIVKTKIVHYSSLCYFPMTFLAAYVIHKLIEGRQIWNKWISPVILVLSSIIALLVAALQYVAMNKDQIIQADLIKDKFAVGNLHAVVYWSGFEFLVGLVLIGGIIFSIVIFSDKYVEKIVGIFITTILFTSLTMIILVPRIEKYSQNAAIEFYQKISKEDCYVETCDFKSYAYLYYSDKQLPKNKKHSEMEWLLRGDVDKRVYIVTKNTYAEEFKVTYKDFQRLYDKNGFVFFMRDPGKK